MELKQSEIFFGCIEGELHDLVTVKLERQERKVIHVATLQEKQIWPYPTEGSVIANGCHKEMSPRHQKAVRRKKRRRGRRLLCKVCLLFTPCWCLCRKSTQIEFLKFVGQDVSWTMTGKVRKKTTTLLLNASPRNRTPAPASKCTSLRNLVSVQKLLTAKEAPQKGKLCNKDLKQRRPWIVLRNYWLLMLWDDPSKSKAKTKLQKLLKHDFKSTLSCIKGGGRSDIRIFFCSDIKNFFLTLLLLRYQK